MHVGDDIMPFCGGSLISSKTVVTSASCLSGEKINRYESLASSMTCITIATYLISQSSCIDIAGSGTNITAVMTLV